MTETTINPETTGATLPIDDTPAPTGPQPTDVLRIGHPDTTATATCTREQFDIVHEPRGWFVIDESAAAAPTAETTEINRDEVVTVRHGETKATKKVTRGDLLDRYQALGWHAVDGTAEKPGTSTAEAPAPAATTSSGAAVPPAGTATAAGTTPGATASPSTTAPATTAPGSTTPSTGAPGTPAGAKPPTAKATDKTT
jgi:hypothetical protein